jgi:hypothetical protein
VIIRIVRVEGVAYDDDDDDNSGIAGMFTSFDWFHHVVGGT